MQVNQDSFLIQQNKQLKEKIKDLEYLLSLYQKKEAYLTELKDAIEERLHYYESIFGKEDAKIISLKVERGGDFSSRLIDGF